MNVRGRGGLCDLPLLTPEVVRQANVHDNSQMRALKTVTTLIERLDQDEDSTDAPATPAGATASAAAASAALGQSDNGLRVDVPKISKRASKRRRKERERRRAAQGLQKLRDGVIQLCIQKEDYDAVGATLCFAAVVVVRSSAVSRTGRTQVLEVVHQAAKRSKSFEAWNAMAALMRLNHGYPSFIQKILVRSATASAMDLLLMCDTTPLCFLQVRAVIKDPQNAPTLLQLAHHAMRSRFHTLGIGFYYHAMREYRAEYCVVHTRRHMRPLGLPCMLQACSLTIPW